MADLPLSGIRVLDFSWAWAGPFCTLQLAHLGAEVIRLETAKRVCVTRAIPPFADNVPGPNRAGYFNQYNQGKRSVLLDLSKPEAQEIARQLARHCDVAVQNFAAGVMDKLGLGYDRLRAMRPDIIMASLSGYGQYGPYREYVGYGPPAGALAGFFSTTGYEGGPPCEIGISYADPNAGVYGSLSIMSALVHRARTGQGQHIDLSQWEAALVLMGEGMLEFAMNGRSPDRAGNHDRVMAPHECYPAKGEDQWVSIAVGTEAEWRSLCQAMGQPALADDPRFRTAELRKRNEAALDEIVSAWTSQQDKLAATEKLQSAGVATFPPLSNKELTEDRHLLERGYLVSLEHPEVGKRIHAGIPWTMSGTPCKVRSAAPLRGADTEAVLTELLGYTKADIERLTAAEVLA
ncbi:MAG: CoA transferase [Candidatus Binataceae bacterium]|jgi:benzylsuccinate CoA-transferase BbsF subunit